jgi:hypothetical protein
MLRSVGTRAFPRAGTTVSTALTRQKSKETVKPHRSDATRLKVCIRAATTKRIPREVIAGGESGAAGRQDGLHGELFDFEQGRDLGDLLRRLLNGVGGGGGGTIGSSHGDGRQGPKSEAMGGGDGRRRGFGEELELRGG